MNVIFLGTPEFSQVVLESIVNSKHKVVGVVTQPDRINSRGNKTVFSKVKEYAISKNLPVFQYQNISKEGDELTKLNADIMVTAAYGQILRQNILDMCKHGVINVHASLLPKYRGSSPVQWALINGEKHIGVTIMQTELGIDTGDIILSDNIALKGTENSEEALQLLSKLGASLIVKALDLIEDNKANFSPQETSKATHCKMLKKEDGIIDFSKDAIEIVNFVRGMTPWPSAYTTHNGVIIKILQAEVCESSGGSINGEIVVSDINKGVIVKCGNGYIKIKCLQEQSGKAMEIRSYLLGKKLLVGSVFGEGSI